MGNLLQRQKIETPGPTPQDQAAQDTASRERLEAIREQSRARTEQLFRLFGSRGSTVGFGRSF